MDQPARGWTHAALRIVAGFLFLCHGAAKLLGVFGGVNGRGARVSIATWPVGVSGCIELVGGTLILLGLFTQVVAFICSGEMAVAYFMIHIKRGFIPLQNRGELAVLFCFVFLNFAFSGAGPFSLDALRPGRRPETEHHDGN
jgi:putative oxidoreductase